VQRRVLIVDDHSGFRSWARIFLESEGFEVVGEACDGEEALSVAGKLRPEVVLLDVQLPSSDGFEVAGRLAHVLPEAAVVLTSSRAATDYGTQLERALVRDVRGFVGKQDLSRASLERAIEGSA
jgi:DNA-binding NarL/FixJ family response regulator